MAAGALLVLGEIRELSGFLKCVAKCAIGAEPRCRVYARLLIHMLGVRALKYNGALSLKSWELKHIVFALYRIGRVANGAEPLVSIFLERVPMAGHALRVPRPSQLNRTRFHRHVAGTAIKIRGMHGVQIDRTRSRRMIVVSLSSPVRRRHLG